MPKPSLRSALAVVLAVALAACSAPDGQKAADRIRIFHAAYKDARFATLMQLGSTGFRAGAPAHGFDRFITRSRAKLGRVVSSRQIGWNVSYGTRGARMTIRRNTRFEHGTGTETFVFVTEGADAAVNSYRLVANDPT